MSQEQLEPQLRHVMAQVLSIRPDAVGPQLSVDTCATWTSLRHLMLISQLEATFGVRFVNREIEQLVSYEAIRTAITARHASGG